MMQTKDKNRRRRIAAVLLAALLAFSSSLAVYAAVSYDSSKDPVVAHSGMVQYVTAQLESIRASVKALESDVSTLKLTGGGGGSGSGGSGISFEGAQAILQRITNLENSVEALEKENASLRDELDRAQSELRADIGDIITGNEVRDGDIAALRGDIANLSQRLTTMGTDISTLNKNFKQISDLDTALKTANKKIDNLTYDSTRMKDTVAALQAQLDELLEKVGTLYEVVTVPYGATVRAADPEDTVLVVLRYGSAVVTSPFRELGSDQGLNDLSDGVELYDGTPLTRYHNVLIPRGGDDGRGVTVTSLDGAYMMIGGDYVIVGP